MSKTLAGPHEFRAARRTLLDRLLRRPPICVACYAPLEEHPTTDWRRSRPLGDRGAASPPVRYWSDLTEGQLAAELVELTRHVSDFTIVRAWTEEEHGPAFAELEDGRTFRFDSDGRACAWRDVTDVLSDKFGTAGRVFRFPKETRR